MPDYTLLAKIQADSSGFEGGVADAQSALDGFEQSIGNLGGLLSSVGGLFTTVGKTLAPVTGGVVALGVAATNTTLDFMKIYQASMTTFKQFYGSAEAARELYNALYEVASASTFSQEAFLTSAQRMAAAGIETRDVVRYMQVAADAVSAFGGTSEDLERMGDVFTKVRREGRLTGETLMQFANSGVDAVSLLAKETGKSTDEIRKMVSDGAFPAAEALDLLSSALEDTNNGFAGMAQQIKDGSLAGALDSMNSAWRTFSLNLTGINPTIGATEDQLRQAERRSLQLAGGIGSMNKILPNLASAFSSVTDFIGGFLDAMVGTQEVLNETGEVIGYTGGVLGELGGVFTEFKNRSDNIDLRPLKRSIEGLADTFPILSGAIQKFLDKMDLPEFTTWEDMQETLSGIGDTILQVAGWAAGLLVLGGVLSTVGGFVSGLASVFGGLMGIVRPIGAALLGLSGPVGIVLGLIATLVGAFLWLYQTNEDFATKLNEVWDGIVEAVKPSVDGLVDTFNYMKDELEPIAKRIEEAVTPVFETLAEVFGEIVEILAPFIDKMAKEVAPVFIEIADGFASLVETAAPFIQLAFEQLVPIADALATAFLKIAEVLGPFVSSILEFAIPAIQDMMNTFGPFVELISMIVVPIIEFLGNTIAGVLGFMAESFDFFLPYLQASWETFWSIVDFVARTVLGFLQTSTTGPLQNMEFDFDTFIENVGGAWDSFWENIRTTLTNILFSILGITEKDFERMARTIKNKMESMKKSIEKNLQGAADFIEGLIGGAFGWGRDLIGNMQSGIDSAMPGLRAAVEGAAGVIAGMLHFSEPDVGPLSNFNDWMPDMMSQMAEQITAGTPLVRRAIDNVAQILASPLYGTASLAFDSGTMNYPGSFPSVSTASINARAEMTEAEMRGIARDELERADIRVYTETGRVIAELAPGLNEDFGLTERLEQEGF